MSEYVTIQFTGGPPVEPKPEIPYQREAYTLRAMVRHQLSWSDWVALGYLSRRDLLQREKALDEVPK